MNRYICILPLAWGEGGNIHEAREAALAKLPSVLEAPYKESVFMVGPTCRVGEDGALRWDDGDMKPVLAYTNSLAK
jgi:hypothetical protein